MQAAPISFDRFNALTDGDAHERIRAARARLGDKAVLLRTIEIEHNIVDCANKVDNAGDWLFLYRFNEKTQRDELIEKVYIGSQ